MASSCLFRSVWSEHIRRQGVHAGDTVVLPHLRVTTTEEPRGAGLPLFTSTIAAAPINNKQIKAQLQQGHHEGLLR